MKSPPKGKAAWADIAHAKFQIAHPELILDLCKYVVSKKIKD